EGTGNKKDGREKQQRHGGGGGEKAEGRKKEKERTQEEGSKGGQKARQVDYKPGAKSKARKPKKKGEKERQAARKETAKDAGKAAEDVTGNQEKDAEMVQDLEQGLYRKRMLSYGGLLKQKHKLLNLDDAEEGNLIQTSDEEKTTEEEQKAHSITAIWNFEKQNYFLKNL
ncbi:protein rep, partial [Staphylococcus epidermidis]|uniref:protein rep n=1 Tax=Staphylococcus epidermidis TaxID=1282 RepID=UPI000AF112D0